jgi:HK97 family phage major capsid protein
MPTPNEAMKEEAQRGLDWRDEFGRGGTEVGIARARDIVNGRDLSEETIGRMVSYFARHEVDKEAEGFRPGEDGYPSNGRIAWALWGGDPGKTWAEREWAKIKNDRDYRPYPNEHAARLKDPDQYDSFRRENDAGGPGIDFIYGVKDGTTEIQAIRFDKNRYSVAEAKKWLESHDFKPILFEEATEREAMEDNRAMVSVSVHIDTEDQADVIEAIANMPQPAQETVQVDENGNEIVMDLSDDRKAGERVTRSDAMEARVESVDDRRVSMSISSESPVQRSYGDEVLDHKPESIDLSFINSGRAPLLLDHDPEKQIGVIESVSLDASARKLRATVRFSKNALASEVYSDVADNIRGNVSIGYSIAKMVKENNGAIYRATSWRPMEASIVSIPADVTVGVGRSDATVTSEAEPQGLIETPAQVAPKETKMENSVNVAVESRAFDAPVQQDVGLNQTEIKRFSLMRALRALANPTDRALQKEAAFEFECSEAAQRAFGQSAQGILVPADVLRQWNKRDLNTSDDAGLVGQNFRPDAFVDALRNASSVMQAGATMLTGLQGNVKIPKKSATSSGGWFAEGSAASESEATFTSITMSPKTVGAFTDVTRNLMMQGSPDVESLIRNDLAASLAIAIDLGALSGSGSSGQPTGIRATSGINTKDFAATNPTFAEIVGMETEVAADNALRGNLAYIINAAMAGALKTTAKDSGSGLFVLQNGEMNGYRTIVSNQAATGDAYFGNFADLLIGMWGGLDILVDPYTSSTTGTVRIVAMQSVDVAVRHAVSFCLGDADIA